MVLKKSILLALIPILLAACSYSDDSSLDNKSSQQQSELQNGSSLSNRADSAEAVSDAYEQQSDTLPTEKLPTKKEKMLKAVMRVAHTNALRQAIDLFKAQQAPNQYLSDMAASGVSKDSRVNLPAGAKLYSFAKLYEEGYLSGKFIVINVSDKGAEGLFLDIMFQHKQDKAFRLWLDYSEEDNLFIVKAVYIPDNFDDNTIRYYRKLYAIYLNDESFGV